MVPRPEPPPQLHPVNGCLSVEETVALARWIKRAEEIRFALDACDLIRLESE